MKKIRPFVVLVLFFLLAWHVFGDSSDATFDFDGEEIDAPPGVMIVTAAARVVAALVSPLLIALAIIWFFVGRARRNRLKPNLS